MILAGIALGSAVVGDLSAWGTAGALIGAFITGFVLVVAIPLGQS